MSTAFLSGMNSDIYGVLMNKLHNFFRMGHDEHLKTLTAAYDLEIDWKGDTKGTGMMSNDGVAFTESEEADVHVTDRKNITRTGKPVICHICGKNQSANRCPDKEESMPGKKAEKAKKTPQKESPPTKVSVNLTIREEWGGDTNYGGLVFCQVMIGTVVEY